ncbi:MAG TPA: VWA domain-containing protein [Candidatus Acidoferrales bacterium]|nr:VWA domain-containing protein [Candidatus Acidoferrales bacterium]
MNVSNDSRILRFLALLTIAALLLPAAPAQQQGSTQQQGSAQQGTGQNQTPPPAQQTDNNVIDIRQMPPPPSTTKNVNKNTLGIHVDLVQIDAVVTDKDGKLIKGLTAANFELAEDGKNQKIDKVDYFDVEKMDTAEKEDSEPIVISMKGSNDPEKLRPIVLDHRIMVLFFDLTSLQPEDLLRSTDAGKKFVNTQMTTADLVSVVSFGTQFRINCDFTNDKNTLLAAIQSLIPGKESLLAGMASSAGDAVTEDTGAAFTADDTEFNIFNTDNKLYAVEALASLLGGIPGRKSVIQFSGGITQTGEENRSSVTAATNAANKNNVVLFQADMRGLLSETPGGDASTGMATSRSSFSGTAVFNMTQQRDDSRDTLSQMAQDTGGKMFSDEGDFSKIFKEVQDDSTGYYMLNYFSSNAARDGRYRAVKVKLVNAPAGAKITHRQGYYAPKDWGIFNTEDREKQLDDAMGSPVARVELPIALDTGDFKISATQIYVPISVKISSSALQWAQKAGKHEAGFDFLYEVRETATAQKRIVGSQRDQMTVKLDSDRFQQVGQQSIVYQGGILLSPGKYHLKFLAREDASGRMGTFEQDFVLPPAQPNKLELSSVLLSSQLSQVPKSSEVQKKNLGGEARMSSSPLDVNGERIVPSVTRVFTSQQTLYVFFQAYAPQNSDPSGLRAGLVFFVNGKRYDDTALVEPAESDPKTHTASFRISLPLEKLPTGRYTVQAVVVQAGGTEAAFGRNYFALRKPPAASGAPAAAPASPSTKPGASPR